MVLSDKLSDQRLIFVNSLALPEIKTKLVTAALRKLPVKGRTTMFFVGVEQGSQTPSRFQPKRRTSKGHWGVESLNVYDLINANTVLYWPVAGIGDH